MFTDDGEGGGRLYDAEIGRPFSSPNLGGGRFWAVLNEATTRSACAEAL